MTRLPSKDYINSLNIDSVERAIMFAGYGLKLSEEESSLSTDTAIEFNLKVDRISSSVLMTVEIAYYLDDYLYTGGNLLESIRAITPRGTSNIELYIDFDVQPSESPTPKIPDFPNSINSLEHYLVYYSFILWASLPTDFSKIINFTFLEGEDGGYPKVQLNIALPINFKKWLLGDNYINSVVRVVDKYQVSDGNVLSLLSNEQLLTNETLLTN